MRQLNLAASLLVITAAVARPAGAEWVARYPKVSSFQMHVYLEGYSLPTFATSPTDPAPSPDGKSVAVAARGWLWVMDIASRQARRLTRGSAVDARPAWSPDNKTIAFTRDNSRDTGIWLVDVASGRERRLVDTPAIDIDPVFAPDGKTLFYSSAEAGDLDLWRIDLASGAKTRLTTAVGQEMNPQPIAGGLVYAAKPALLADTVETLSFADNRVTTIRREGMSPQLRLSASPDGRSFALTALAGDDRTQLQLSDIGGGAPIRIANNATYPLTPAWARDGGIWFVQPDRDERFKLYRVASTGGAAVDMTPLSWELGEPTARLTVRTRRGGAPLAARLAIVDGSGHPAAPDTGNTTFDGQHGRIFFHSPGVATVEVPAGDIAITASHGFDGAATTRRKLRAGETATIDLDLPAPPFDAAARGYFSGDLHSHLNYGGPFQLEPEDMVTAMRAEALDISTPEIANLQTTLTDVRYWGWQRTEAPLIRFGQEVRAHFLGHVAIVGADAPHTPFFLGPGYPVYDRLDLSNASPMRFAREHGGMNIAVHPVPVPDPFPKNSAPDRMPVGLVPDALSGDIDALEIACLWTDELGTGELWYRFLNLGLPIVPSGGSDTMHNLHRTMAIGSTRVYAKPSGPLSMTSFIDAVRAGRSFVSNGPMLEFTAGGAEVGAVVPGSTKLPFTIEAWSAAPVDQVEVIVNGRVAWSGGRLAGFKRFTGSVEVPTGGWVAARVRGGAPAWPAQDSYLFAHSAPIWLGTRGSRDPAASRAAAADLLRWMDVADTRLATGYNNNVPPTLRTRFAEARAKLAELAR